MEKGRIEEGSNTRPAKEELVRASVQGTYSDWPEYTETSGSSHQHGHQSSSYNKHLDQE